MASNCRIEYSFGPPRPATGHSLGVSATKLTTDISLVPNGYGTLFTGGRDGRINAFGLTTATLGAQGVTAARVSDIHTNWVSDIEVLSKDTVASCSVDTTVKLWNLGSNQISTIGHHTDYAECLTKLSDTVLVSGGLDERILGWDVTRAGAGAGPRVSTPIFDIHTGHGIYAIACAPPHLVVTGSSDGAVRIWDTRQSHYIAKFTGHTDSVRSLFVANGDTVVSGSSDATVRVWSLRSGRIVKTLNQFQSSVWSLQPWKSGFMGGDRLGNIYSSSRLDEEPQLVVERAVPEGGLKGLCPDPATSHIWLSTPFSPDVRCINPQTGAETERIPGHKGLRKHRLMNDKRRCLIMDTDGEVGMADLVSARMLDFRRTVDVGNGKSTDAQLDEILEEVNTMDVLDHWCHVQTKAGQVCVTIDHRSINNTEVYLDDLTKHVEAVSKSPFPSQSPGTSPRTSPLSTPLGSGFFRQGRSPLTSPAVSRVTSSQSLSEIVMLEKQRQQSSRLGTGQGHAKFYSPEPEEEDGDDGASTEASFAQRSVRRKSSKSSTKPKVLPSMVPPNGSKAVPGEDTEEPADSETADDEIRINLGNFVLENLLRGVVIQLKKEYDDMPTPPSVVRSPAEINSKPVLTSSTADSTRGGNEDNKERKRTRFLKKLGLGRHKDSEASSLSNRGTSPPVSSSASSVTTPNTSANPVDTPQIAKQKLQLQQQKEPDSASFQEAWSRAVANRSMQSADPESPEADVMSRKTRLVIIELVPGAGAPTEIFSTTVDKLLGDKQEVERIEKVLPGWVGDALLLGKLNLKSPTKIGFAVTPAEADLPGLTTDNTRLMAISMLRARKIMAYTVGQLQQLKVLSAEASNHLPEELISLSCHGSEVSPLTTLGTIRTRIWRQGGDVLMEYRLKKRI